MNLRLTPAHDAALTLLAASQGLSKHEAVLQAIVAQAARLVDDAAVVDLARRMLPQYVALEQRLATAPDLQAASAQLGSAGPL